MYHDMSKYIKNHADEKLNKEDLEAIGKKMDQYKITLAWLKENWSTAEDSTERRIISPLINPPISPILHAIIADNVEYFKLHYLNNTQGSFEETATKQIKQHNQAEQAKQIDILNRFLNMAFLSGSQNIAEFIMAELKINYLTNNYDYILGFVSSSPNFDWAKQIANTLAEAKRPMPKDIYRLAKINKVEILLGIFGNLQNDSNSTGDGKSNKGVPPKGRK